MPKAIKRLPKPGEDIRAVGIYYPLASSNPLPFGTIKHITRLDGFYQEGFSITFYEQPLHILHCQSYDRLTQFRLNYLNGFRQSCNNCFDFIKAVAPEDEQALWSLSKIIGMKLTWDN